MLARVTIKACNLSLVIHNPLNSPYRAPITKLSNTAGNIAKPFLTIREAHPVETRPTIEPTDRSISPRINIIVIPIAIIPVSDTARSTFIILGTLKKIFSPSLILINEATTTITIRAI